MKQHNVALIGGGPSALFILKKLIESNIEPITIDIFESAKALGKGMPYSCKGALKTHVSNVSSDEVPPLVNTLIDWVKQQNQELLSLHNVDKEQFHEKSVVPRLLLGSFLADQFDKLIQQGEKMGFTINVHLQSKVYDIELNEYDTNYSVLLEKQRYENFDKIVICTGHLWPKNQEAKVAGYFDSPYPPNKLNKIFNHSVALKGASLTAVDAIRALSEANGVFLKRNNRLVYETGPNSANFKIVIYTLDGLLPSVRFHLDEPLLSSNGMLSQEQIDSHKAQNKGFVSLDFLFERNFKHVLEHQDPAFYKTIAGKDLEAFVNWIIESRKAIAPSTLLKIEYIQAEQSIKSQNTIQWKQMLALLSYTINYPAKYFSGEDMLRLKTVLQPLIAIIIADMPQSSAEQLLAMHECGKLEIVSVDEASQIKIQGDNEFYYARNGLDQSETKQCETKHLFTSFIDCTGQKPLPTSEFPFASMFSRKSVASAKVKFKDPQFASRLVDKGASDIVKSSDANYYLTLEGFAINDHYQFIYADDSVCANCFMMAVPFISGFNPDYSGFDFCDQVSTIIVDKLKESLKSL